MGRVCGITATGSHPTLGERLAAEAKQFVLYGESVQDAISPIAVAEGRYFRDECNRYLDFASQLVNVSIGHQHPRIVDALGVADEHAA
jgi:taurine--2-oxoglutarate transaminase